MFYYWLKANYCLKYWLNVWAFVTAFGVCLELICAQGTALKMVIFMSAVSNAPECNSDNYH